ncbi:MAG: rhamnulokinase [Chloroflexi bacterium]|nr:rhamnulokinase [Chloroflexota bacterium]
MSARTAGSGTVAAVDLGASSGRVITARVGPGTLSLEEVHRFSNTPVELPDGLHWDILGIFREVIEGLRRAGRTAPELMSVGIDSWAIDYGLLDADGRLLGNPYTYRDGRSARGVEEVHALVSPERLYARTGLQFLPFNTIYQLAAARGTAELDAARTILLIPDLIGYWLSGQRVAEVTNASTTGLFDIDRQSWADDLVDELELPRAALPPLAPAGDRIGPLQSRVTEAAGLPHDVELTLVGSHDTASAVVGVPAEDDKYAYISCGTWALVGVELEHPVRSDESRSANFTNEAGVDGRVRYLRNVTGLWLLDESFRAWERSGVPSDLTELLHAAAALPPGGAVIDPNDPTFLPPGDMPARIVDACRRAGQPVPASRAALVRCILESLASTFGQTVREASLLSGRSVRRVHVVGGGSRNTLLCQLTADACELPVVAGPVEATAIGNVLVQGRALGLVEGDLSDLRALVRATHPLRTYEPHAQLAVRT